MILSFDVFDTIITRALCYPADVFYFVGEIARNKNLIDISPDVFLGLRIQSEREARKLSKEKEITLDEIYQVLQCKLKLAFDVINEVKNIEINLEYSLIYPIAENIDKLVSDSVLISDMYLSKEIIGSFLSKCNIPYKELFVSSEYKASKGDGSLFDFVLNKYKKIDRHFGDNFRSDYRMPKKKGIRSILYEGSKLSRYESLIYSNPECDYKSRLLLAGAMKATRLSKYYDDKHIQKIHEVASNVMGPVLFLYVDWIIRKAVEQKIERLFFLSRDGQILLKIADLIIQKRNIKNLEVSYMYGSRTAWHLPSFTKVSDEELKIAFQSRPFTFSNISRSLGIKTEDISSLIPEINPHKAALTRKEKKEVKNIIINNENIKEQILNSALKQRQLIKEYLEQLQFSRNQRIGIVIIGWRGSQQRSLMKLCKLLDIYPKDGIVGFYLSTLDIKLEKDSFFSFIEEEEIKLFYPCIMLYEIFVSADHGKCFGYEVNQGCFIEPALSPINNNIIEWGLKYMTSTIIDFCSLILNMEENLKIDKIKNSDYFAVSLLKKITNEPTKEEALCFGDVTIPFDREEFFQYPLCPSLLFYKNILLFFSKKSVLPSFCWTEGTFARNLKGWLYPCALFFLTLKRKISFFVKTFISSFIEIVEKK